MIQQTECRVNDASEGSGPKRLRRSGHRLNRLRQEELAGTNRLDQVGRKGNPSPLTVTFGTTPNTVFPRRTLHPVGPFVQRHPKHVIPCVHYTKWHNPANIRSGTAPAQPVCKGYDQTRMTIHVVIPGRVSSEKTAGAGRAFRGPQRGQIYIDGFRGQVAYQRPRIREIRL